MKNDKKNTKKICLINNLYKPYNRGGAERTIEMSVDKLIKDGNKIFIITTKPRDQCSIFNEQHLIKEYYLPSFYYNLNKIPIFFRLFWHIWDIFDFVNYFKVKKILKKEKPDIVITHNLKGISYLIPLVIKKLGIKHIHTLHDIQLLHPSGLMLYGQEYKINNFFAKIYTQISKYFFASPDTVISPSKWLMKMHTDREFFKNSKLGMEKNYNIQKSYKNNINNKCTNLLYVGQIEKHKGILFLVNVFKNLKQDKIKYKLTIVGNGSKLKEIKNLTKYNKNISILGKKNKHKVKEFMQSADYLIVPSLCYENSPTVIYEAMKVGLPIIASHIGGIPELVDDKFLFKPGNEKDFIKKIKIVLS